VRLCELGTEKKIKVNSCIKREEGRIPFGSESDDWTFDGLTSVCGVCGVPLGSFHHPGCDVEECPKCHEQLLICDCERNHDGNRNSTSECNSTEMKPQWEVKRVERKRTRGEVYSS
jgi:hypothetical protein